MQPVRFDRAVLPAVLFAAAVLTTAWAWWVIAWPVLAVEEAAGHAGHHSLLYVHVLGGSVMLAAGTANLFIGWTRRSFRFHRAVGYTYLLGGGAGAVLALPLAFSNVHRGGHEPLAFGLGEASDIGIATGTLALAWLAVAAMALRAARNRRIEAHRDWMIRSYVLTWTFVFCRIAGRVPAVAELGDGTGASQIWVAWVVPFIACEIALQWRSTSRRAPAARPPGAPLTPAARVPLAGAGRTL